MSTETKPTARELAEMLDEALERWPGAFGPKAAGALLDVTFTLQLIAVSEETGQ